MTAAELAPAIVLTSVAGVFADRWNRKRMLVIAALSQAVAVLVLLLVRDDGMLWLVYVVAVAQSSISAFSMPAEAALLPTLVPREEFVQANAMNALNNRLGRLSGVPLGAALLGWFGLDAVVLVDAATFLVAAALVAPIVVPAPAEPADQDESVAEVAHEAESALASFWREWREGLHVVRDDRTIAVLFLVFGLMTFGGTMIDPLFVPWIRDVLEEGVGVVAALSMTHSLAGIVGSLLVGRYGARLAPRQLIGWPSILAGIWLLLQYNVAVLWVAVVLTLHRRHDLRGVLGRGRDTRAGTGARAASRPGLRFVAGNDLAAQPARRGGRWRARRSRRDPAGARPGGLARARVGRGGPDRDPRPGSRRGVRPDRGGRRAWLAARR